MKKGVGSRELFLFHDWLWGFPVNDCFVERARTPVPQLGIIGSGGGDVTCSGVPGFTGGWTLTNSAEFIKSK
ncbi:hypothetical protein WA1_35830 [Scytonema hofmannii PCC 7110]|uniref:Uncharacterized protein n=1 Tax=Scytonema hofmannii PCC 7110 TaxID=128403 RepID=A0A139X1J4_9CYAN|nr:hypothetical protein WA1_35830 [Scytonema hofmannii PCC 7110]